jgi:hypothetical protein
MSISVSYRLFTSISIFHPVELIKKSYILVAVFIV